MELSPPPSHPSSPPSSPPLAPASPPPFDPILDLFASPLLRLPLAPLPSSDVAEDGEKLPLSQTTRHNIMPVLVTITNTLCVRKRRLVTDIGRKRDVLQLYEEAGAEGTPLCERAAKRKALLIEEGITHRDISRWKGHCQEPAEKVGGRRLSRKRLLMCLSREERCENSFLCWGLAKQV